MSQHTLNEEVRQYTQWREALSEAIGEYKRWLRRNELSDGQTDTRLDDLLATLSDNRLYIAFVAEYSRGKSELINAIFFADTGHRVLPSRAGRTTMCPTELMFDPEAGPMLRLLPIETRSSGTTIAEYKGFPEEWTEIVLNPDDPRALIEALEHLAEVKLVQPIEAQRMGLHVAKDEAHEDGMHVTETGMVEIPRWRHAIVSYPHPLLEKGLVILDTPGLNALGAEPELTLSMLASAHAVMFVLACDTGVTKSDMGVWRDHIRGPSGGNKGALVVLNKIDTLWDELREVTEVDQEIERQVRTTARTLDIPEANIYPVSAQKALAGKVKRDRALVAQSRIEPLEEALAETIIPAKRDIVRDSVQGDITDIVRSMRMVLVQRINGVEDHLAELDVLNSRNVEVIEDIMAKVKADKDHLEKSLQRFQATRSIFAQQTNLLYTHLNMRNLDALIAETKMEMEKSATTAGMRQWMVKFFVRTKGAMEEASAQAREIKALMDGVYRKFQEEHGLAKVKPASFSATRYIRELSGVEQYQSQVLSGMSLVMTEQMAVSKKFFESGAARARQIYERANRDVDAWLKNIMSPMESQVREHQIQLRRRLESIKRIHKATDSLDERLKELNHVREGFREQERLMEEMASGITRCLDAEGETGFGVMEVEEQQA